MGKKKSAPVQFNVENDTIMPLQKKKKSVTRNYE